MGSTHVSSTEVSGSQSEKSIHALSDESVITGLRFNNEIYTVRVDSTQRTFTVHKNILELSPVLKCMTSGSFLESRTKEIVLPEDDADNFGRIVEHLYGNNVAALEMNNLRDFEWAKKLAELYGLAEKYQLPDFQDGVIQKLKQLDMLKKDRMAFFHIASKICESTRDLDQIFDPYFAEQAAIHLESMSSEETQALSEMLFSGGSFAKKIYHFQVQKFINKKQHWVTEAWRLHNEVASLKKQVAGLKQEVTSLKAAAQEQAATLKPKPKPKRPRLST